MAFSDWKRKKSRYKLKKMIKCYVTSNVIAHAITCPKASVEGGRGGGGGKY